MNYQIMLKCLMMLVIVSTIGCQKTPAEKSEKKEVLLFNGKDLTGWTLDGKPEDNKWVVGTVEVDPADPEHLIVKPGGTELINAAASHGDSENLYSDAKFGDCHIDLELMIPKGSNSGIYVAGEYEIQVFDSFGKEKLEPHDMGAVFGMAVPSINACKAPGEWQHMVIDYRAPRFDANGQKIENARLLKVVFNGQTIHENLEMPNLTPSGVIEKESPTGPLMFQGNHGPVAYRNIKITPLP